MSTADSGFLPGTATVKTVYNANLSDPSLSPISLMAVELVTKIMVLACGPYLDYRSSFLSVRGVLMLVCHRWREVVVGCGDFWSTYVISPLKLRSAFDVWTSRFRGCALHITIDIDWQSLCTAASIDQLSLDEMLACLPEFLPMCWRLTICAPDTRALAALTGLLANLPMPNLRSLDMTNDRVNTFDFLSPSPQPIPLHASILHPIPFAPTGLGPSFMRLSGLVLTWTHHMFYANVTTLILQDFAMSSAPTVRELHAVLKSASLVRRVSIAGVCCSDYDGDVPELVMVALQALQLRMGGNASVARLIYAMRAPLLTSFHVFIDGQRDVVALAECSHLFAGVTSLVLDGDRARDPLVYTLFGSMPLVTHCDMAMNSFDFFRCLSAGPTNLFPLMRVLVASEVRFPELKLFLDSRGTGAVLDILRLRYIHDGYMTDSELKYLNSKVGSMEIDPPWDTFWYH
ncbi:hypothetical protein DFH06DRAFT_1396899 [Mycena polygramma]|nr:hypothetical protein DFH06DRAFT_1396899 [Mycena polygramma]